MECYAHAQVLAVENRLLGYPEALQAAWRTASKKRRTRPHASDGLLTANKINNLACSEAPLSKI
jgi:hypothetical protein